MVLKNIRLLSMLAIAASAMYFAVPADKAPAPYSAVCGQCHQSGEGEEETAGASLRQYFFEQRLFGNPDINIYQTLLTENARFERNASMRKAVAEGGPWTERGPWNIGGRMRGIAMHPTAPNVLWAGAASGGVWKSTNYGTEWIPMTENAPLLPVGAIAIDPTNPLRVYAGTGEPDIFSNGRGNGTPVWATGIGLLKTEDGGATWNTVTWASSTGGTHRIAIHPTASDTIFAATTSDLWRSMNAGANWSRAATGVVTDVLYTPGVPSRVYYAIGNDNGGSSNGVYVSDAGGKNFSFRKLSTNFPAPDSCGRICLSISPANPNRVYAAVLKNRNKVGTNPANDFLAIMVSTNAGETWERKVNAITASCTNGQGYYDLAFAASPIDANVVLLGGLDVFRSTNGGQSFSRVSDWTRDESDPKYVHADIHFFAFQPGSNTNVVAATDGGVSVSSDRGTTWSRKIAKLGTIQYYSCNYDPSAPTTLVGGTQDNGTLGLFSNDNAQWFELFGGDGGTVAIDPQRNTVRYVCSTQLSPTGSVVRSIVRTGVGASTILSNGLGSGATADFFTWVPALLFHPTDRTRLYTATQYVYTMKNPDAASPPSWSIISPDLGQGQAIVTKLAVAPGNGDWMYAVTSRSGVWITKNLTATSPSWTRINSGLPVRWLTDVCIDNDDPQIAWITLSGFGSGHVYRTTNTGQNWSNISNNLPDVPANAIVRSRTDANVLFVATDLGVFYSSNGGAQWQRHGTGLPNVVCYDMKITPANTLVVGTHGRGMWTTSAVMPADPAEEAIRGFALGNNFPTASVSGITTIPFRIASAGHVRIALHDLNGRLVAVLLDEQRSPGAHAFPVALRGIAPGVYFYAMEYGGLRQTKKMVVF